MTDQRADELPPTAGWYAHPNSGDQLRWWDGETWTNQYAPRAETPVGASATQPEDRVAVWPPAQPTETTADARRWGTVWVWLLALSPWLSFASVLLALYAAAASETPEWYWAATLMVPYLLVVGAAVLDVRTLRDWHPETARWAWAFLGALPYLIARAVVLRRRGRFGSAPLWVGLGSLLGTVLTVVAMAAVLVWIFSELTKAMS